MSVTIVEFKAAPIIVRCNDLVWNGKTYPIIQEAVYKQLLYSEDLSEILGTGTGGPLPFMNSEVVGNVLGVKVHVMLFEKNEDGSKGPRIPAGLFPEYEFDFLANNTTWVDNETGAYLAVAGEETMEEHIREAAYDVAGVLQVPAGKLAGKKIIRENAFFDRLGSGEYQPGVRGLIFSYIDSNKGRVQPKPRF